MPKKLALKPPFKWVGGKSRSLKHIEPYFMNWDSFYCEPFLGAGAVFLATQPKRAFLTDANQDVIDAWYCIKDNIDALVEELRVLACMQEITKKFYLAKRKEFNVLRQIHISELKEHEFVRRSALFMFLLKMCYNGVYTITKDNEFRGGMGDRTKFSYDTDNLIAINKYLNDNDISFDCMDYKEAMSVHNIEYNGGIEWRAFWYIDPPYHTSAKFYNAKPFTEEDQRELAGWCEYLKHERKCYLVINNRNTPLINEIYPDTWWRTYYDIQVSVSADKKDRVEKSEILVHNIRRD